MDGKLHLFWILGSALFFNYIFQEYQVKLVFNNYLYIILTILFVTLFFSLFRFGNLTKKTNYLLMISFLILFVAAFLSAIYLIDQPYIWLFVLMLYKYIPYVSAYLISRVYALPFEKIFFLILFLPFITALNTYTSITGTMHVISIKDLFSDNKKEESYIVD